MEDVKLREFININSGSGYGDGYGSGYGSGYGYGIKNYNGKAVNMIDGIATIIDQIHGNIAKGSIVRGDLSTEKCYVIKQNNMFAHGETLHAARSALMDKLFEGLSEDERIEEFVKAHKAGQLYSNTDFFKWHNRLTGSCEMGRKAFAADHGIDMSASMTPEQFILLTENAYGGSTIKKLKDYYRLGAE